MNNRIGKAVALAWMLILGSVAANAAETTGTVVQAPGGNFYEFVAAPGLDWDSANAAANALTYLGRPGHLATITSQAEGDAIEALRAVSGVNGELYVGGFQDPVIVDPQANWQWVNSEGAFPGINGQITWANWHPNEPNDAGVESHLAIAFFSADRRLWNDEGALGNIKGYVVEYENTIVVAEDDMADTLANLPADIAVLDNDDAGDEPLTVTIPSQGAPGGPENGTTSQMGCNVKADCVVTYTPDAGFGGTDSFVYTVTDVDGEYDTATVTIEVEASVAVAEPDPDNPEAPVTVFMSAEDPNNNNPFDFLYQEIPPGGGGMVTADCCTFQDYRETAGNGRGHNLFFKPRKLDIGKALRKSVAGSDPFDLDCAALIPLVPKGAAVASPWQRIAPDPDPGNPPRYGDIDYVESLVGAFCVIQSDVVSDGIALTSENPEPLVGYDNNCDEDDRDFRPVTGTISLDPSDKDAPYIQTSTAECDRARNARRSSTAGYWINMRNTSLGHAGQLPQVLSMLGSLKREIRAEKRFPSCSPAIPTAHLNALKKQLFLASLKVIVWSWNPQKILDRAIPELDALTLLALDTPSCSTNFKGLVTGRSMAATFAACSYLGHPNTFDADKVGSDDDCLINPAILDEILDTTP